MEADGVAGLHPSLRVSLQSLYGLMPAACPQVSWYGCTFLRARSNVMPVRQNALPAAVFLVHYTYPGNTVR